MSDWLRQHELVGLRGDQTVALLLREGETHHRLVAGEGQIDDLPDAELDPVADHDLVGPGQRCHDPPHIVDGDHGRDVSRVPRQRPPCGDAVDQKREPEAEPFAGIVGEHRLLVGQVCARGVPLQPGLLVGGEAQHVVDDRAGGQFGVCGLHARVGGGVGEVGDDPRHRLRLACGEAGRHQLGAVGVRQQGVAQAAADPGDPFPPVAWHIADGLEDPVGDRTEKLLLVGEMPVQRAGGDIELAAEPAHRQVGDPVVVQDRRRRLDHVAFVQLHPATIT